MKIIVTLFTIFCLSQIAMAESFVDCYNHKGEAIFKGVVQALTSRPIEGGIYISALSVVRRNSKIYDNQGILSKLGFSTPNCKYTPTAYSIAYGNLTLYCASAVLIEIARPKDSDDVTFLNQNSVLTLLSSEPPQCSVVIPQDKLKLLEEALKVNKK